MMVILQSVQIIKLVLNFLYHQTHAKKIYLYYMKVTKVPKSHFNTHAVA